MPQWELQELKCIIFLWKGKENIPFANFMRRPCGPMEKYLGFVIALPVNLDIAGIVFVGLAAEPPQVWFSLAVRLE